jgi:DNA-binding NarL/FixJ family response regulator
MDVVDELIRGREAYSRGEWRSARDRLSGPDLDVLEPDDLRALATAAYLVGDTERSVQALQRSFQMHEAAGDSTAAARDALLLTTVLDGSQHRAASGGWLARAARLLESTPETGEHGFLRMNQMFQLVFSGRMAEAHDLAIEVAEAGRRHAEPDLVAIGLVVQGRMSVYQGRVPEGMALLDEAMVGVSAGEVSPIMSGRIYCIMIDACQELDDVRRMTDWTQLLSTWCERQEGLVQFTGQAAVHRAQIMRAHGAWPHALDELRLAEQRYVEQGLGEGALGEVYRERGDVLRLQGELDQAASAYTAADERGNDPQPGITLLWLAQGRVDAALAAARRMLEDYGNPVRRSRVLPTVVEVLLEAGDVDGAGTAAEDLTQIAGSFGSPSLDAAAAYARGSVSLARDDPAAALADLRTAWRSWLNLGARYEAAWARTRIGQALRAMGDEDSAAAELAVAGRTFADLGAAPAQRAVERLLGRARPDGLTPRELEVLRLVAAGRSNPQIAAELVLSEKTVARHLSNIFGKTNVKSRTEAAAYAFQHQLV